jgi:hypothetical protein
VLLVISGCGGGGDVFGTGADETSTTDRSSTTTAVTTMAAFECPDPIGVDDVGDITGILAEMQWKGAGPYGGGVLPVTPDLVVTGTVIVESADVPVPESCLGRNDCLHAVGFSGPQTDGVALDGSPEGDFIGLAGRLTLSDTTVRLRPVMLDTHPGPANSVPSVRVLEPCGTPCGPSAATCPADGVCYDTRGESSAFCLFCEGKGAQECACSATPGTVPDGESCSYFVSGDVVCTGTCRDGTCVGEGC